MSNPDRAWTAEQVEDMATAAVIPIGSPIATMLRAYAATLHQQTTNPPEIGSKLVGQQADHSFASPEALADWLESLHETNADGAITGGKWEPSQVAACAIRSMGQQAKQGEKVNEAMVDRALTAYRLLMDHEDGPCEPAMRAALEAGAPLLRAPAEKMEAARCPPTYRREEAVKAVTALGWKWDGKAWIAPAPAEKCGRVDEASRAIYARLQSLGRHLDSDICDELAEAALAQNAQGNGIPHPDDVAVDCFAFAMKEKLAEARAKGRSGWQDKADCPHQRLSDMLRAHVEKGDPRDVGNFAMFLHQRGESILPAQTNCDLQPPNDYNRGYSAGWDAAKTHAAQNAQREAVGEIVPRFEGHSVVQLFDADLPLGTKLYLHAERARVSEGWKLVPPEITDDMEDAWISGPGFAEGYRRMLAAAPSQPEDADHE